MRILEALGLRNKVGLLCEKNPSALISGSHYGSIIGVTPAVSFSKLYEYYKMDQGVQAAVNTFRDNILGQGFYITSDDANAQKIIEQWNEKADFENKLWDIVGDMLITGNSLVEKVTGGNTIDVVPVDMKTITKAIRDDYGKVTQFIQQIDGKDNKLDPKNFIHFKLFNVAKEAFGIGLFHSLAVPYHKFEIYQRSLLDDILQLRADYANIVHKRSSPRSVVTYENADEAEILLEIQKHKNMKQGETMFTNKKFEYQELDAGVDARFMPYAEFLEVSYEIGQQTPSAKLTTSAGFTEASAKVAKELLEDRITAIQRKLAKIIEKNIYSPILAANNIDIQKVNLKLQWGLPDQPEVTLAQVRFLYEMGLLSWEEARVVIGKSGVPLDKKTQPPTTPPQQKSRPEDRDLEAEKEEPVEEPEEIEPKEEEKKAKKRISRQRERVLKKQSEVLDKLSKRLDK